jgi:hypothetical protein
MKKETGENSIMMSFIVCTNKQIFKSRLIIWLEHMACVEKQNAYRVLVGIHIQNSPGLDGRILLKFILYK